MASDPITSWQIDGDTLETVADFILGGSKITVDVDCSHEIKRCLLLRRKAMTNIDSILKSRDITLPTKVCLVKVKVKSLSHVQLFVTPWILGHQAPCDFPWQEYWSGLPFPSPEDLPDPGMKPRSHLMLGRQSLYHWATSDNGTEKQASWLSVQPT